MRGALDFLKLCIFYILARPVLLVLVPVGILLVLYQKLFGTETNTTPDEIVQLLRRLSTDPNDQEAWEVLDYEPIKEPRLAAIRKEAQSIPHPVDETGRERLTELLARAEALALVREV